MYDIIIVVVIETTLRILSSSEGNSPGFPSMDQIRKDFI